MPDKDPNDWMNDQLRARAGKTINRGDKDLGERIADALRYERTTHEVTRPPSTGGAEEGDQDANRSAS
jgi:hypothetical protein